MKSGTFGAVALFLDTLSVLRRLRRAGLIYCYSSQLKDAHRLTLLHPEAEKSEQGWGPVRQASSSEDQHTLSVLPGACSVLLGAGSSSLCLAMPSKAVMRTEGTGHWEGTSVSILCSRRVRRQQGGPSYQFLYVPAALRSYAMLCYVTLCYVMLCYVMLCYVVMSMLSYWIPTMNPCSEGCVLQENPRKRDL